MKIHRNFCVIQTNRNIKQRDYRQNRRKERERERKRNMSYIHYKLITNQNYEKITFDGVSLNVNELKKLILEKKFRKSMNSSAAAAHNSNSLAGAVVSAAQLRKMFDVDLEITNVDTNEGISSIYIYTQTYFIDKKLRNLNKHKSR